MLLLNQTFASETDKPPALITLTPMRVISMGGGIPSGRRRQNTNGKMKGNMNSTTKLTIVAAGCLSLAMYLGANARAGEQGHGRKPATDAGTNNTNSRGHGRGGSGQNRGNGHQPSADPNVSPKPTPPGHHYGWERGRHNPHHSSPSPSPSVSPTATPSATPTATPSPTPTPTPAS